MNKYLVEFIFIIIFLNACGHATPPSPHPPTATLTIIPTETPNLLPTSTATITPYPPLQTDGPYLLFANTSTFFTIMDVDGSGRIQFELPKRSNLGYPLGKAISPDGRYIVYFSGSSNPPNYDITINLYDLQSKKQQSIMKLIAPGFPQNLEPVAETAQISEYDSECFNDITCKLKLVESAFLSNIQSFAWSPNSQELAFAAQIDGPSSDIYLYKLSDMSIQRITNDLENVKGIEWSPNGDKILYLNSIPGRVYDSKTLQIADLQSELPQDPQVIIGGAFWDGYGWLDNDHYLITSSGGDGAVSDKLEAINIDTQQIKSLWSGTFEFIAVDHYTGNVLISTTPWYDPTTEPETGVYLISNSNRPVQLTTNFFEVYSGLSDAHFFGMTDEQAYALTQDGTEQLIGPSMVNKAPNVSPNQEWFLLYEDENSITLYSGQLEQAGRWRFTSPIHTVIWRPDSTGLFLSTDDFIYYLAIPDGEPIVASDCHPVRSCTGTDLIWLP